MSVIAAKSSASALRIATIAPCCRTSHHVRAPCAPERMPSPIAAPTVDAVIVRRSSVVPDIAAAVMVTAFLVLATSHIAATGDERSLDALGYAVLVVAGASVGLCRRWPAISVGIVTGVLTIYLLRHYTGGPVYVTGWIALFFLSWRSSRRTAIA